MPPRSYVFVPFGSHGDVHPIVGLAIAMQARGHKVAVATNGYFRSLVEANNLEFIELGTAEDYLKATNSPDLWQSDKGTRLVLSYAIEHIKPVYEILLQRWQQEPCTLVATPLCFSARLLHEVHQIPLISTHLQPLVFRSAYETPVLPVPIPAWAPGWWINFIYRVADKLVIDPILCPVLNRFRQELGLKPVRRVMNAWWNSPQRIIGLWPSWFAAPLPDWPAQAILTGFPRYDESSIGNLPSELETFLAAGSAPIAFTPGSAMRQGQAFFETAVAACQRLQRRGILLSRFDENIPDQLPDSILHVPYAPFSQLLPRCAALVHHGGIGTLAQGFAAGIVQLLMPMAHDQPDNLARLKRLGAGDGLVPEQFTPEQVAEMLGRLLGDTRVLAQCAALKHLFADDDALGEACRVMEAPLGN